ncbi:hypothetical protein ACP4OV_001593 [Aristida adscensionis]
MGNSIEIVESPNSAAVTSIPLAGSSILPVSISTSDIPLPTLSFRD